jgi:hypothetical protein
MGGETDPHMDYYWVYYSWVHYWLLEIGKPTVWVAIF